jgi:predicted GNAT family acetyltransferase
MTKQDTLNNGQQKAKRPAVDYDRIEPGWRAGVKSVLQLAAEYEQATGQKVSHTAISKHFGKKGIARDLKGKVQAKAQAKVAAAAVSTQVATETRAATKPTETAIIEANADLVAHVLLSQRTDIKRNRTLVMTLLGELEESTLHGDKLVEIAESLIGYIEPDDVAAQQRKTKMMVAIDRALSLGGRIDSMKKLADTLKTLVALEREAYGITAVPDGNKGGTLEDFLDELD